MKIAILISRILLGLLFFVFGLNGILHFMKTPAMPPSDATTFATILMNSGYMTFVSVLMVVAGLLLLVGRYVPLALVILGPILVNILLFHALLMHAGFQMGVLAAILWFIVFSAHRAAFAGIFAAKA